LLMFPSCTQLILQLLSLCLLKKTQPNLHPHTHRPPWTTTSSS
jgi:hypothetical protein